MADLVQEIEAQIAGAKAAAAKQTVGVIREIGDGVAKVEGLGDVMLNEMLDFGQGITGLALNLDETEVGVIILGDYTKLEEGGEVKATGKLLQVPVGKGLLGRVVNTLGEPLDGKGPIPSDVAYPVEKIAPGIIRRKSVSQPVQTGIMPIDAMIPIGRGQRELIIGDRSTGKTTICLDTIISQARLNQAADAAQRCEPTARSTASTSPSARSSRRSRASSRCSTRQAPCPTASSSRRRPLIRRQVSTSRRLPARRLASGSWTTAWTRSSSTTTSRSTPSRIARSRWCSSGRRAAKPIPVTCSISTAACSSEPHASARSTATAR